MEKRQFTKEFKVRVMQELAAGRSPADICREHEIKPDAISRWKKEYARDPEHAFSGKGNPSTMEARNAELERKIGQLYLENEFIKKVNTKLQALLAEVKKNPRRE